MKNRFIRALAITVFALFLYREAAESDILASAFQEEIEECLEEGNLPVVMLSQESGEYDFIGVPARWAAEYAVDQVNGAGGINGCDIRLIVGNTHSEKSRALSLYEGAQRVSFLILGPVDAPETAYISSAKQNGENNAVHLAAYSYAESRQEVAPFGISYMSDSEDGELEAVKVWAQQNPDISDVVIFTMSEDESKKSTSAMFQDTFEDLGLHICEIIDVKSNAEKTDYQRYAIQALNQKADGYVFLLSGEDYANILVELRKHGVEEGRRISASFSSYVSDTIDIAKDALDGTYIWNKFDPLYEGEEWQELLDTYDLENGRDELIGNSVADYYDAVMAICTCYEELGVTDENYRDFLDNPEVAQWFYNSGNLDGIQGDFYWSEGKKVMDYQFFLFQGKKPVNQKNVLCHRKIRPMT